jgi:hypothetical protein
MYNNTGNELWVSLAEKAYVQLNELGWSRPSYQAGSGVNAYTAIDSGYIYLPEGQITGLATVPFNGTSGNDISGFAAAWNAGELIGFASKTTPASSSVVGSHAYAVVGYDAVNHTITLFNPWGISYGLLTLSWSDIQANFDYFDHTV